MPGPRGNGQKPKNFKKTLKRFIPEIKPYRTAIIVSVVLSAISVLLTIFGPMLLGMITTSATTSIAEGKGVLWEIRWACCYAWNYLFVRGGI